MIDEEPQMRGIARRQAVVLVTSSVVTAKAPAAPSNDIVANAIKAQARVFRWSERTSRVIELKWSTVAIGCQPRKPPPEDHRAAAR